MGPLLVIANYLLLTLAYRHGDLSFVYPISGAVLVFLQPLAYVFAGERLDVAGWAALAVIVSGIACVQLPGLVGSAPHELVGSAPHAIVRSIGHRNRRAGGATDLSH